MKCEKAFEGCDQNLIEKVKKVLDKIPEDRLAVAVILIFNLLQTPEYRGKVLRYVAVMLTEEGKFLRMVESEKAKG